jgi:hypothetical protein
LTPLTVTRASVRTTFGHYAVTPLRFIERADRVDQLVFLHRVATLDPEDSRSLQQLVLLQVFELLFVHQLDVPA